MAPNFLHDAKYLYRPPLKHDFGKTKDKYCLPLKNDATFKKQPPSKILVHLKANLANLMDELKAGMISELKLKVDMNSCFVNPVVILPRKDYVKLILDARFNQAQILAIVVGR